MGVLEELGDQSDLVVGVVQDRDQPDVCSGQERHDLDDRYVAHHVCPRVDPKLGGPLVQAHDVRRFGAGTTRATCTSGIIASASITVASPRCGAAAPL